jgi:hypothetical protein
MTKIAGPGSISQRHGSADPDPDPNPHQKNLRRQEREIHGDIMKKMRQHSPCILVCLIRALLLFRPNKYGSYALVVVISTYKYLHRYVILNKF